MVERIDNSLNIASPTSVYVVLVSLLTGVFCAVVGLVAIYKTVGHNEVHHIRRRETVAITTACATLADHVIAGRLLVSFLQGDAVRTRLIYFHVHEQIVRTFGIVLCFRNETQTCPADYFTAHDLVHTHLCVRQVLAMEHQRQWGVHVGPPAQRFYLLDFRSCCQPSCQQKRQE